MVEYKPGQDVSIWVGCPHCGGTHYAHVPPHVCTLLSCTVVPISSPSIYCITIDIHDCLTCEGGLSGKVQPATLLEVH